MFTLTRTWELGVGAEVVRLSDYHHQPMVSFAEVLTKKQDRIPMLVRTDTLPIVVRFSNNIYFYVV